LQGGVQALRKLVEDADSITRDDVERAQAVDDDVDDDEDDPEWANQQMMDRAKREKRQESEKRKGIMLNKVVDPLRMVLSGHHKCWPKRMPGDVASLVRLCFLQCMYALASHALSMCRMHCMTFDASNAPTETQRALLHVTSVQAEAEQARRMAFQKHAGLARLDCGLASRPQEAAQAG
jgi:hypothetical protein